MWKKTKQFAWMTIDAYTDFRLHGLTIWQSFILTKRGAYNLLHLLVALDIQRQVNLRNSQSN